MTVVELWKALLAVGRPRRGSALSMTSSWTRGAVCRSSTGGARGRRKTEAQQPGGGHSGAGGDLCEAVAAQAGDMLNGVHEVGWLVAAAAVGLGRQVGGVGLHGHPAEGDAASDGAYAVRLGVGAGAGDGEHEAELDVAEGEREIAGEAVHDAQRAVLGPVREGLLLVGGEDIVGLLVGVAGVDDDGEAAAGRPGER